MRVKKARVTRWSTPGDPNGCVSFEANYLSLDQRAAAGVFIREQAARDRIELLWTNQDWALTENIRLRYVNGRQMELDSLPDNDEWDSLVSLVRGGCAKLVQAAERTDFSANKFWTLIGGDPNHPTLRKDQFRSLIETLKDRVGKADAREREILAKTKIWEGDAWSKFVVRLAEQWRAKGITTAVRKSDRQQRSAFVAWVAFAMLTLPRPLWKHTHGLKVKNGAVNGNWGAISQAVYKTLRARSRILKLIDGSLQGELRLSSDAALRPGAAEKGTPLGG